MAIIRCKMCGGDLTLQPDATTAECEYCGSLQTVPLVEQEKKLNLFTRANRLRFGCEFDKAYGVYEAIVAEYPEEPEAYWGLVLCKYGIEYVDDPLTGKKIPTCHRASFQSVTEDGNYRLALQYADSEAERLYHQEAKTIEGLRREIQEVSARESPYEIFICYKESRPGTNERTLDSVLAQDLYDTLTDRGYRVFFARVTLEDKVGQAYEPYIFAALNSAKVMLAVGTDYEHFNAVWVKNEWRRYLMLMQEDRSKHLVPCYKDIDIEDLPQEFRRLQAQDLGKVGAVQDLLRGIEKLLGRKSQQQPVTSGGIPLLERGNIALEDRQWKIADDCFEKLLRQEPQNAGGYIGKLLAQERRQSLTAVVEKWLEEYREADAITLTVGNDKKRIRPADFPKAAEKYLDTEALEVLYRFDGKYTSQIASREEQLRQARNRWESNPYLLRAEQFADEVTARQIADAKGQLLDEMQSRLEATTEAVADREAQLRREYEAHLQKANEAAAGMYDRALTELHNRYKQLEAACENETDPYVLRGVVRELEEMDGYKNSVQLVSQGLKREKKQLEALKQRKKKKKEEKLAREMEIYKNDLRRRKFKYIGVIGGIVLAILLVITVVNWNRWRLSIALSRETFTYEMAVEREWCSENANSFIACNEALELITGQLKEYYEEGNVRSSIQLLMELPREYSFNVAVYGSESYMRWLQEGMLKYGTNISYDIPLDELEAVSGFSCTFRSVSGEDKVIYYTVSSTGRTSFAPADSLGVHAATDRLWQVKENLSSRPVEVILPNAYTKEDR